jgi:hypothetical protein
MNIKCTVYDAERESVELHLASPRCTPACLSLYLNATPMYTAFPAVENPSSVVETSAVSFILEGKSQGFEFARVILEPSCWHILAIRRVLLRR